jgi:glyoxylase-like metal-dependent hydrolase (beta-lactamase superfamily II)
MKLDDRGLAELTILHTGYVRRPTSEVAVTVLLVRAADAVIVADPGMVADPELIVGPLRQAGVGLGDVTHVFLTHHHPDHITHVGLFPNATVVDYRATHFRDRLVVHAGEGYELAPGVSIMLTPGHSEEDASLVVRTREGVQVLTHCWWWEGFPVDVDPRGWDDQKLAESRRKVLAVADVIIPCHGAPFPARNAAR